MTIKVIDRNEYKQDEELAGRLAAGLIIDFAEQHPVDTSNCTRTGEPEQDEDEPDRFGQGEFNEG